MKLIPLLLFVALVQVSAESYSQEKISISEKNASLEKIFKEIRKQSKYDFLYINEQLQGAPKVSVVLKDVSLEQALKEVLKNSSFTYSIQDKTIVIRLKEEKKGSSSSTDGTGLKSETPPPPPLAIDLRGIVVNEKGEPVEGATVAVKGTDKKTSTNGKGEFTLSGVNEKLTLVISAVTIETKEVRVDGQVFVKVEVVGTTNELDETIIVAYNTSTKRSNVGAVTIVKGDDIRNLPAISVDKNLQGFVPGLLVTSGTGQPGGGLSNFVLRGVSTSASAENGSTLRNPLIVIDGIPVSQDPQQLRLANISTQVPVNNPMAQINPSDIESISVLKDAAAIALYGSKASNGVILITTKMGKLGKTRFNFRSNTSVQQRLKGNVDLLAEDEYMELLMETYKNSNPALSNADITNTLKTLFPTRSDGSFYPFQNLEDEIYTKRAITSTNEFSMSGGNGRNSYYLSLEWTKQNGTYRNTEFDRKSLRYNFSNRVTDWLKIDMNNSLSYNKQDYVQIDQNAVSSQINSSAPLNPLYLENGELLLNYSIPNNFANPVAAIRYNTNRNMSYRGVSVLSGEARFLKNFHFISSLGVNFQLTESKEKRDPRLYDGEVSANTFGSGRITEGIFRDVNLISTNKLLYAKTFNRKHSINVLVAQEAQVFNKKTVLAEGIGLRFQGNDQIDNTVTKTSSGSIIKQTLLSYFSQATYDFSKKYFLSGSIRTDGDSKFGSNQQFGTYWSLGAGWVISDEFFMKQAKKWLNYLKLRGSIGQAGNSGAIDRYTKYTPLYNLNSFGGIGLSPSSSGAVSNPDIKWENTFSWDIGLEATFWDKRLSLTADIYNKKTSDLIYAISLPLNTGSTFTLPSNIGDIVNRGMEVGISGTIIKGKIFSWTMNANWSTNQNKLVKANVRFAQTNRLANEEGRHFESFHMEVWAGVDAATGQAMWIDTTGKPSTNHSAARLEFVGKPQPDGFGSVNQTVRFKDIEVSALFYYQYGYQVYVLSDFKNDGGRPYSNQIKDALNRWQKPGDIASNPKRTLNNNTYLRQSTRYLFDGDHIRLQTLSLAYNFSREWLKTIGASGLKIYLQAHNLALWTKVKGNDVADANISGSIGRGYPNSRTYSFGLNLEF